MMSTINQARAGKGFRRSESWRFRTFAALLLASTLAFAGSVAAQSGHWVGTWATSPGEPAAPYEDTTLRQIVYVSIGGDQIRVRFSNLFGEGPLEIAAASVAVPAAGADVVPGTLTPLTFGGEPSVTIAAGARALSDPVDFDLAPASTLAVSLYVAGPTVSSTMHTLAHQTNYVSSPGDYTGDAVMPVAAEVFSWFWLSGIEVFGHPNSEAVVTAGDSITEGFNSTLNANARYPDELARRLLARKPGRPQTAVLNAGISGNRLLSDVFGPNGQSRLDRDVLSESGATRVILLEGINDLGLGGSLFPPPVSAEQIIAGYKQVIRRVQAQGLEIYLGTITPCKGFETILPGYWSPAVEAERQAINAWIRETDMHDGFVDFDAALRNPADPESLLPVYDSGDFLHPSDAGYARMAEEAEKVLFAPSRGRGPGK
jgi:lysophospholipase L1-like esterase